MVAKVVRRHEVAPPKILDLNENFKAKHTLFFCSIENRFTHFLEDFGKKVLLGVKYSVY